jgi:tungstate transport system substrate-binding protein
MLVRHIGLDLAILILLAACAAPAPPTAAPAEPVAAPIARKAKTIILATTTSTQDSGLLDAILPDFTAATGIGVDVIAVGSGQAMEIGARGDADVLLVHARAREDELVANGDAPARYDVMVNDFVIVGPPSDPAGIKELASAAEAFAAIAAHQSPFLSRGDDSGTHSKEQAIWKAAAIEPAGGWYQSAGQGMGAVLTMANEQQAYTLSDRATYLARKANGLELDILVEGDNTLFNPYGVLPISQEKHPAADFEGATAFVEWITSPATQKMIGDFGVDAFGQSLFIPSAAD